VVEINHVHFGTYLAKPLLFGEFLNIFIGIQADKNSFTLSVPIFDLGEEVFYKLVWWVGIGMTMFD